MNFLAEFAGDVAHQAREALEDEGDSHHADLHDGILHLIRNAVDNRVLAFDFTREFTHAELRFRALGQIGQPIFRNHQLANQVHQPIDFGLIDFEASWADKRVFGATAKFDPFLRRNFAGVVF